MPGRDRVIEVVHGWVEKAENDLTTAAFMLQAGERCPADVVAFHAQQCAEKYVKAVLAFRGAYFPKTHDLHELVVLLAPRVPVSISEDEERRLTAYATVTRYPGGYPPVSLADARRAIAVARRVRAAMRRELPKEALRRARR